MCPHTPMPTANYCIVHLGTMCVHTPMPTANYFFTVKRRVKFSLKLREQNYASCFRVRIMRLFVSTAGAVMCRYCMCGWAMQVWVWVATASVGGCLGTTGMGVCGHCRSGCMGIGHCRSGCMGIGHCRRRSMGTTGVGLWTLHLWVCEQFRSVCVCVCVCVCVWTAEMQLWTPIMTVHEMSGRS